MIPKKIHYCWFGGNPLPKMAQECIASWKKHCPDYEIIEWNESNFDINCCDYVREAYEAKKWAFVSDVARLYVLVNHGGIYMDTDVEVIKSLDDILLYEAVSGFESNNRVPTGLMACVKGQSFFYELLHDYDNAHFRKEDGSFDLTTNVIRITNTFLKYNLKLNNTLQTINGVTLFPYDYFCPKDFETGIVTTTKNTYVIHHFDGSWLSEENKFFIESKRKYSKFLSKKTALHVLQFISIVKFRGFTAGIIETKNWIKHRKEDRNVE